MEHDALKDEPVLNSSVTYSVIIPAYNEELLLPATLSSLSHAMQSLPFQGEVLVVDNCSTDDTARITLRHGARVVNESYRQIARARNAGAHAAFGKYLVFLDADTILPGELLAEAIKKLDSGSFCGGGSLLSFDTELPFLAGLLVKIWNLLSGTAALAAGSFIFCLTRSFRDIGGFDESVYAGEEIFFSRRLKAWGRKNKLKFTVLKKYPVITSSRKFHWHSSAKLLLLLIIFIIFPLAARFRSMCSFWYERPAE